MNNTNSHLLLDKKSLKRISIQELMDNTDLLSKFNYDLMHGAVCVIPTDTMYGFAADSSQIDAVEKIYKIKNRDKDKPLILFVSKLADFECLGLEMPKKLQKQLTEFWPGALTAIIKTPQSKNPQLKAFNSPSIGIRIPDHSKLLHLLEQYPQFFLTTSVNKSEQPPLLSPNAIEEEFGNKIDWLIEDGEYDKVSSPSTIVDFTKAVPTILRQGKRKFSINLTDK